MGLKQPSEIDGWDGWYALGDELLESKKGYDTDDEIIITRECLEALGYDGIKIIDDDQSELVVFSSTIGKLNRASDR